MLAPLLYKLPVFREFHDSSVARSGSVAVRHKDVAIRRHYDPVRLIKCVRAVSGDACLPKRHQNFPVWTELDDLLALAVFSGVIGRPDVSFLVDIHAVRDDKHARAQALDKFAGGVKLKNWSQRRVGTGIAAAPLGNPDISFRIDGDGVCRSPLPPVRKWLPPTFHRTIGIGRGVRLGIRLDVFSGQKHGRDTDAGNSHEKTDPRYS